MRNEDKIKKIEDLEVELNHLPSGYISKKTIYGKTKYYYQWQEDGKKKSKYIPFDDLETLEKQINRRRIIQEEIKDFYNYLPKTSNDYITNIKVGVSLKLYVSPIKDYKKRECYKEIINYLYHDIDSKVLILYGLRRTGKTTLIRQAINEMNEDDLNKSAFIQITRKDDFSKLNHDLKILESQNYRYIFIDEVTLMEDFIEGSAIFSDVFASSGMKIILTGTDSLGFMFTEDDQLYDRAIMIHTTYISYHEFETVLGIKGIDEYIRYGGTMSISGINYNVQSPFNTINTTNEYVDSAISKNIQHSLKYYQYENHFRSLEELYRNNELTIVINRVVEDINHRFTYEVLTRDFKSNDFSLSAKNLRNDNTINNNDILDSVNKSLLTTRLKELLEIKNKNELKTSINENHQKEIKEYLILLDLIIDIDINNINTNKINKRTIFVQPGMRYSQSTALIQSLLLDNVFNKLSINDKQIIIKRIKDEIKGRMLEDIILLETKLNNPTKEVFKIQFAVGEFDMVVFDNESISCDIYEIKHSDKINKEQYKNLLDENKCNDTIFRYGNINHKYVIYRGPSTNLDNGIHYLNVEDYLNNLS